MNGVRVESKRRPRVATCIRKDCPWLPDPEPSVAGSAAQHTAVTGHTVLVTELRVITYAPVEQPAAAVRA